MATQKTLQTAIDGRPKPGCHVLLWVQTEPVPRKHGGDGLSVRAVGRRCWPLRLAERGPEVYHPEPFGGPDSLAALLPRMAPPRRGLTVWLSHGWESLVLSGLAELLERKVLKYDWCTLDGQRVIVRGRLGKRRVDVTSLAAWTGGEWDSWRDSFKNGPLHGMVDESDGGTSALVRAAPEDEKVALASVVTVLGGCQVLSLGSCRLSVGSQARAWWRAWGGPRGGREGAGSPQRAAAGKRGRKVVVYPVPRRPAPAAAAEGHCCFGLIREQYFAGNAGRKVHVVDLKSAYLLALATCQLPAVYDRVLVNPKPPELEAAMIGAAGCALVRLDRTASPFCVKRHDKPVRAIGSFWCWLTEPELARAFHDGTVAECHTAWLWRHVRQTRKDREDMLSVSPGLKDAGLHNVAAFWRQLYSSLAGGWAQRDWGWIDDPRRSELGNWATWTAAGATEGTLDHWRAVGGRVQRRVYKGEKAHSLPLAYATITALVRDQVDWLRRKLPDGSVLATVADGLWVTDAGLAAMRAKGNPDAERLDRWAVKETFDDVWIDGAGGAVVRKGGDLYPLLPGVPAGAPLGADGRASWPRAEEWTAAEDVRPDKPRRRRRASFDGGRLVRACNHALRAHSPWQRLARYSLPERLLLPYNPEAAHQARGGE